MKKILKIRIPVTQLEVVFKGMDDALDLAEVLLDLERQLNNLKIVSEIKGIGMYPRFHLGGNPYEYKTISVDDPTLEGRPLNDTYQSERIRVSSRQRKDSGVQEDVKVQQGEGAGLSKTRGLQIIEETLSHFEDGLINTDETFNKIADVVLRVATKDLPGATLSMSDKRLGEILKEKGVLK